MIAARGRPTAITMPSSPKVATPSLSSCAPPARTVVDQVTTGSSNIALARTAPAMPPVIFVARLPSPYREAVTLVELEGPSIREAAEVVSISARCLAGTSTSAASAGNAAAC
jgi:hypothetical protein